MNGDDIVVTVGDGSILLCGAATVSTIQINSQQIFADGAKSKLTLASGIEVGDATERTAAIRITSTKLSSTILGGSGNDTLSGLDGDDYIAGNDGADKLFGNKGDDTLWGGLGNDTLTGGADADTFVYIKGESKDVITDFGDDDLLQITGTFSATYDSSANTIAFKIGSTASAITLKNFTATTFNINGDSYAISGTKLVKQ